MLINLDNTLSEPAEVYLYEYFDTLGSICQVPLLMLV